MRRLRYPLSVLALYMLAGCAGLQVAWVFRAAYNGPVIERPAVPTVIAPAVPASSPASAPSR